MSLAEQYRPDTFQSMCGQEHLVGANGILTNMLQNNNLQSVIFYGPPGCGKTTAAKILAAQTKYPFVSLNATNVSLADIRKEIAAYTDTTLVLYLDEIQYFNKKQQQSLLPYVESGEVILIAATTDNPYYCCIDALLSRCIILEFEPLQTDAIKQHIITIAASISQEIKEDAAACIADNAAGDLRRALNLTDLACQQYANEVITLDKIKDLLPSTRMAGFDTDGDTHFSLISGLQKSIRGSDPNAAIFYLARLLEGGDLLSPCRRLMVIAHEDIGLANPDAIPFVYASIEMAKQLGLPEANKPLTNAVLYLAISPKASTCENTYNAAAEDVKQGRGTVVPTHLRHAHSKGYLYPHDYPNHWVRQQYLPDDIKNRMYYQPENNIFELKMAQYWSNIMLSQQP